MKPSSKASRSRRPSNNMTQSNNRNNNLAMVNKKPSSNLMMIKFLPALEPQHPNSPAHLQKIQLQGFRKPKLKLTRTNGGLAMQGTNLRKHPTSECERMYPTRYRVLLGSHLSKNEPLLTIRTASSTNSVVLGGISKAI